MGIQYKFHAYLKHGLLLFCNLHLQGKPEEVISTSSNNNKEEEKAGKLRNIMMGGPGQMGGPSNIMGGTCSPQMKPRHHARRRNLLTE